MACDNILLEKINDKHFMCDNYFFKIYFYYMYLYLLVKIICMV